MIIRWDHDQPWQHLFGGLLDIQSPDTSEGLPPTPGPGAKMFCQYCGKQFFSTDEKVNFFFVSASFKRGSYTSPNRIFAEGELILRCPVDPMPALDRDMERGDPHPMRHTIR